MTPKQSQTLLAIWAVACAKRVLPYFTELSPTDKRPQTALEAAEDWIKSGVFSMSVIRKASLDAHAAAKDVKTNDLACFAAHAAGQAVATAHVREHAFGPAMYSLKLAAAKDRQKMPENIAAELAWQDSQLPADLKAEWYAWQSKRLPKVLRAEWEKYAASVKNSAKLSL